jgi:formyl-CoA transferase
VRVGIPIADLSARLFCAMGILIALLERETSGKGQAIETSLLQAQIFMLDFRRRAGWSRARWPSRPATIIHQHSDRRVQDQGRLHQHRHRRAENLGTLLRTLGAPELIAQPEYANVANRSKNRDAINAEIDLHTAKRTSADWVERFNKAGVPRPDLCHRPDVRRSPGRPCQGWPSRSRPRTRRA